MATFEQGFGAVEAAAEAAVVEAANLAKMAKKLLKAAREGDIGHIRRESTQLTDTLASVTERVKQAAASWPFAAEEEPAYLDQQFSDELCSEAEKIGLNVTPSDDVLVCSPSIIRLLSDDRAVRIDGKKRAAIRPSKLAADLQANQQRQTGGNPRPFLEALFKVFKRITDPPPAGALFNAERMVTLDDIYATFTTWPVSSRHYTRTDFARQIYLLDISDATTTKSGARISFHHSTAARSGRKIFSFVDPDGNLIPYYGVQFTQLMAD